MTYDEIIKIIKEKDIRKILVFGPPRSGTTFVSFVFAKDLNLELIPEEIADKMSERRVINTIISKESVFHTNSAILYFYKIKDPTVIKIRVYRDETEVILSAERVNIINQLNKFYTQFGEEKCYVEHYESFWNEYKDDNSYLLDYESLKSTKYWISKRERKDFAIKQVTITNNSVLGEFGKEYFERVEESIHKWDLKIGGIMQNNRFVVVVPVYNAEKYIEKCLTSILSQDYDNYELVIIDDCSTDNTYKIINDVHASHDYSFIVCRNHYRVGSALANIVKGIELFSYDGEDIIVTIDGDDFLYNDKVLSYLDDVYQDKNIYMTYGQYLPLSGSYGKYCSKIDDIREYRNSGLWYASHLRTFKNKLWYKINDADLKDENNEYYKIAGDAAYIYPMLEMCGDKHHKFIDEVLYVYNDLNSMNDMKMNMQEQIKVAELIRNKNVYNEIKGEYSDN